MNHVHTQRHGRDRTADDAAGSDRRRCRSEIARRDLLLGTGALGTALLAGCLGDEGDGGPPPDPVSIEGTDECDFCGMVIPDHPGPNGQIFYRDNSPETHENPARFDSAKACLFPYLFEHEQLDWQTEAIYVTDYSTVDHEIVDVDGQQYVETATDAETFSDAEEVVFVIESRVHGAMGPDFIPFSVEDDATAFIDRFGGRTVGMDDVTLDMVRR
jgi:copper chaperone NosL